MLALFDSYGAQPCEADSIPPVISVGEAERHNLARRLSAWFRRYPDVDLEPVMEADRPRERQLERSASG
ncbi:hypothetical protein [Amycolatopsis sp. NPDC051903]|uniref:hypothetical protein n=1 Tax=Amycolatopsis sp. NPDC051903 TaxID=3363936 RepID=UPI0037B811B0